MEVARVARAQGLGMLTGECSPPLPNCRRLADSVLMPPLSPLTWYPPTIHPTHTHPPIGIRSAPTLPSRAEAVPPVRRGVVAV